MQPVERVRTAGRAFERLVAHLEQRRENGCDGFADPARPGAARGRAPGRARPRDLRARPRADLGDRPGHRHAHRPGHPRRHRPARRPARPRLRRIRVGAGWNPRRRWASRSILAEAPPNRRPCRWSRRSRRGSSSGRCSSRRLRVALYLIFLLRKPIGWVLIATFLAVALSGPVNALNRHMRRGSRSRSCTSACC